MSKTPEATKTCNACGRTYATDADFLRGTSRFRVCAEGIIWFNCGCGSTLILPKEKVGLYRPEKGLSPEAANLFVRLDLAASFPRFPAVAARFEQMLSDPGADAHALAGCVAADPVLVGRILQAATFHMESTGRPVRSIEHAIAIVGRDDLRRITMVSALASTPVATRRFSRQRFWRDAFLNALLAQDLSGEVLPPAWRGVTNLCASLCDLGVLARAFVEPDEADMIEFKVRDAGMGLVEAEETSDAIPHEVWGELAAALWGLPDIASQACVLHHSADAIPLTGLLRVVGTSALRDQSGALADPVERRRDDLVLLCVVLADERRRALQGGKEPPHGYQTSSPWARALFGEGFLDAWVEATEIGRERYFEAAARAAG